MTPNDRYLFVTYVVPVGLLVLLAADVFWGALGGLFSQYSLAVLVAAAIMPYGPARWIGACWRCRAWARQATWFFYWPRRHCDVCGASRDQTKP